MHRPRSISVALRRPLALACSLLLAGAALAAPDAALLAAAEKAQPGVIENLKEMVLIESGSKQKDGLLKMADLLDKRLQALGFKTERRQATAGAGADNLIGTLQGTGKRNIMLLAHMDTVYQPGILAKEPFRIDGNRIYGPGIADDKGGIAVILGGLQILLNAGWRDFGTLTVMFNPDEEVGSQGSGELIAQLADKHDVALSFEPSAGTAVSPNHVLVLGASGILEARLEVTGRAAHAGNSPKDGRNALYELAHQILQTRDIAEGIPGAQLSWTTAQTAGNPFNQIPAKAEAVGDVRINRAGADQKLDAALRDKIKARLIPDTQVSLKLETNRPIFLAGERGLALAKQAQGIYQEIGRQITLVPMVGGGTDAAYLARSGKATVVEALGLAGWGYHAKDEYIEADSIVPRLYLLTRLLTEIGKS
ncbi:MAG TPA: glutamate carboxypeptidase [Rubrivivax sp.]|nr:glutamate carboxypeptidase [Rubrivivax sp.]HRZ62766.1 glutamate carboxypeptidase [Rubrivivax sp.]